jgi:hypothetical protein
MSELANEVLRSALRFWEDVLSSASGPVTVISDAKLDSKDFKHTDIRVLLHQLKLKRETRNLIPIEFVDFEPLYSLNRYFRKSQSVEDLSLKSIKVVWALGDAAEFLLQRKRLGLEPFKDSIRAICPHANFFRVY